MKIENGVPALVLAPMEGVTDAPMRALLTERGGFSFCVSEFIRISQDVPGSRCFVDHVPELKTGCKTNAGVSVGVQILGGHPEKMALSAVRAYEAGASAIDINFGCPAPTVNRNDGGATLLKYPMRIRGIVEEVRRMLPSHIPVSAKLRLGWDSIDSIHENAERAAEGGASWITIHGRTKEQGYRPPAYWEPIGQVKRRLKIPIIANGEIWTVDDFDRCRDQTGCEHFMIGRSALADPNLQHKLSKKLAVKVQTDMPLEDWTKPQPWIPLLLRFSNLCLEFSDNAPYALCRIKQWLRMASLRQKIEWIELIKRADSLENAFKILEYQD